MTRRDKILIIDDEASIRDMVQLSLELAGFDCIQASNAKDGYVAILDHRPSLVLLDWMMPETTGYELLRRLRRDENTETIPVIMLTAKVEDSSRVSGLEGGADDYVSKPFSTRELIARIRANLRRVNHHGEGDVIHVEGLRLDPIAHRVDISGVPVDLGPTEFRLLRFLMNNQDRAYTRGQLLDNVWGHNVYIDERTVDVHVRRLRKALEEASVDGKDFSSFVQTVRGTGYRFSRQIAGE